MARWTCRSDSTDISYDPGIEASSLLPFPVFIITRFCSRAPCPEEIPASYLLCFVHAPQLGFNFIERWPVRRFIIPALLHKRQVAWMACLAFFWYVRSEGRHKFLSYLHHHIWDRKNTCKQMTTASSSTLRWCFFPCVALVNRVIKRDKQKGEYKHKQTVGLPWWICEVNRWRPSSVWGYKLFSCSVWFCTVLSCFVFFVLRHWWDVTGFTPGITAILGSRHATLIKGNRRPAYVTLGFLLITRVKILVLMLALYLLDVQREPYIRLLINYVNIIEYAISTYRLHVIIRFVTGKDFVQYDSVTVHIAWLCFCELAFFMTHCW